MVAAAVLSTRKQQESVPEAVGKPFLPEIDMAASVRIVISTREATSTIELKNGSWVVAEKHGFPADIKKLRNAISSLKDIKISDVPRLSPAQREQLGVVAPPGGNEHSASITFSDAGGNVLTSLLLGKTHMRQAKGSQGEFGGGYPDGRYVSSDGGKTICLISDVLNTFSEQPLNWIEKSLLNVSAPDLTRVVIQAPGAQPLELQRPEGGASLALSSLASNETLEASELSAVGNALSYFDLSDVASPALSDDAMGLTTATVYMAETTRGIAYTVSIGEQSEGDSRYVRISARKLEGQTAAAAVEGESATDDVPDVQSEVDDLNNRLSQWTFIIAGYKADSLTKTREELAKPKAPEAEVDAPPGEAQPGEVTTRPIALPAEAAGSGTKE